ncbi:hypothetical protein [Bacillus piscicola]|uniref:hypothetical protein n=1 Tax=Bacillus piscicola TaxID=1632684 RepID=UPI001F09D914|nr:hypothetical protein [Bacillus piscicola]
MADNLQQAMEAYEQAQEIAGQATTTIHTFQDMYDEQAAKINTDTMLSDTGKAQKREQLNKEMANELFTKLQKDKQSYQESIVKATNRAKDALAAPHKKPHDTDIKLHEKEVNKLKMDALMGHGGQTVMKLKQYADKIEDPYLAENFINELPSMYERLINKNLTSQEKTSLHRIYEDMQQKAMTDEQRQAQQILASTEGAFSRQFYNQIHNQPIAQRLGSKYAGILNRPDDFNLTEYGRK